MLITRSIYVAGYVSDYAVFTQSAMYLLFRQPVPIHILFIFRFCRSINQGPENGRKVHIFFIFDRIIRVFRAIRKKKHKKRAMRPAVLYPNRCSI